MEHLTKAQIVLLTIFVSFVASMATGIVVVTLMQQSPEPVTQTLTKVVERTIEKITANPTDKTSTSASINVEDLTVAAIERNIKSTVVFKAVNQNGESHSAGIGTIVSADGLVVTDTGNFGEGALTTTVGGVQYALQVVSNEKGNLLGLGRLTPVGAGVVAGKFTPVTLGNPDVLKLGQTTIVIGGWDGKTVMSGLVNNLEMRTIVDKEKKTETKVVDNIGVSTRPGANSNGAPIISLSGEVVGFLSINESAGSQFGVPASEAKKLLEQVVAQAPAKTN